MFILSLLALLGGLVVMLWSADRFVSGAAATARHFGMPSLLIGMIIVGFGTSAPELIVSAIAAYENAPGIALGNAYGSNICNIALILGFTAMVSPVIIQKKLVRREIPILTAITILTIYFLTDLSMTRFESILMLIVFAIIVIEMVWSAKKSKSVDYQDSDINLIPINKAFFWLIIGLIALCLSSRTMVWAAVYIAHTFGISDMIIGLTVVAVGTSLPELASSIVAARKGEHDIAFGNIIGSNIFNTLAVVGIAGSIAPIHDLESAILSRDMVVMTALTLSLFLLGRSGRISRMKGVVLVGAYVGYTVWLVG